MKYCSDNYENFDKYIISYNIDGDLIKVRFSNDEIHTIPYTIENEDSIISIMEKQDMYTFKKSIRDINLASACLYTAALPMTYYNMNNYDILAFKIIFGIMVVGAIETYGSLVYNFKRKKELNNLDGCSLKRTLYKK